MTDHQITTALTGRTILPTVYGVICEFHCGYQQAWRCLQDAAKRLEEAARKRKPLTQSGLTTGVLTQEDF